VCWSLVPNGSSEKGRTAAGLNLPLGQLTALLNAILGLLSR